MFITDKRRFYVSRTIYVTTSNSSKINLALELEIKDQL